MNRIFYFIFALCCLVPFMDINASEVKEGNKISGHVIEDATEENIAFASILIVETGEGTMSNEEGKFTFTNLTPGKYTLRVSAVGYQTSTKEVIVSKDYIAVIHFTLKLDNIAIDEVVVSASRNEIKRWEAPVVVSVASEKLFETINAPDLAKSLNYVTGLRVENNCQNCGFPQVRINGLEGPHKQPPNNKCAQRSIWP